MYKRYIQVNKVTLGNQTLTGASATRLFEGVAGDKTNHGDLFGIENIFRFSRDGFEQSRLVHRISQTRDARSANRSSQATDPLSAVQIKG